MREENITENIYSWEQGTAWTICMLIKMYQSLAHSNSSSSRSCIVYTPHAASPEHGRGQGDVEADIVIIRPHGASEEHGNWQANNKCICMNINDDSQGEICDC